VVIGCAIYGNPRDTMPPEAEVPEFVEMRVKRHRTVDGPFRLIISVLEAKSDSVKVTLGSVGQESCRATLQLGEWLVYSVGGTRYEVRFWGWESEASIFRITPLGPKR
jgi:hypothetical protein